MKNFFKASQAETAAPARLYDARLQAERQQNIKVALERDDLTTKDLVTLFGVARAGVHLAFAFDGEKLDDTMTFFNQQAEIRDRLKERPSVEVLAANLGMSEIEIA